LELPLGQIKAFEMSLESLKQRRKVVLYNPKALFFDMPLALLAIGSVLDPDRFEVVIVDGRIEEDAIAKLREHLPNAVCFGVTVLTGAPVRDALDMSAQVRAMAPEVPIIWGGWHTSLFPMQPLQDESFIDVTVQGQGEVTFKELVDRLDKGQPLDGLQGICFRKDGKVVQNPPRALENMDDFAPANYDLIDVEAYFGKKGRRQFDYISSTGCFFRCSFCADPFVFNRKFSAISPARMGEELGKYHARYQFTDINFQDETFFTYAKRSREFAQELIDRKMNVTWAGTMRADQGCRLEDADWQLAKQSGLRRLLIGVESGSQEMMDYLRKDIKIEQVLECAEKCREMGIDVHFPFIVGFPKETDASVAATVAMVKRLSGMSPGFRTPIFYFKPYPGSKITEDAVRDGYVLPATTREWAEFDFGASGPWVSPEKFAFFENFKFYNRLAHNRRGNLLAPLKSLAHWRLRNDNYRFPIERRIVAVLRPELVLS
jgi:anaerobic magnesium-protoporphyrin IX monomethyl ester cyclase